MKILIAGFPYVRESFYNTFKVYPKPHELSFLLPKFWPIKNGKFIYQAPKADNVLTTRAFFSHSHYPIIGGLLKGWLPLFPLYLSRQDYNLIYSCSEPILLTTLYQAIWSKLFGCKHIMFSWENIAFEQKFTGVSGFLHNLIMRLNLWLSDGLICGNGKGAKIYEKYSKKPISVIPMSGLDPQFFKKRQIKKKLNDQNLEAKLVFTFIGALGYRKGVHLIIEALSKIIKIIPEAHVILVGSGEFETEIDQQILKADLSSYITRLPWLDQSDLLDILSLSDVFLYPSLPYGGWEEQFGYSIAEASLMELPIISTKTGSIADLVIADQTGLLIEPNNSQALEQAMLTLARDEKLRHALGQRGRNYIIANYSQSAVAKKFYQFFRLF